MSSSSTQPFSSVGTPMRATRRPRASRRPESAPVMWPWPVWVVVIAATIGGAIAIVVRTAMHPSFDAYGWMVWGHQIWYGHLNLNAAPSWKPLTAIFTIPYALLGNFGVKLWSVTSNVGTLLMAVFAFRVVYRLGDGLRDLGRWGVFATFVGALFAAAGELGIEGLSHLSFIANSDQLNAALVLAAFDAHFSRRPRLAYVVLFLAALGRPELWVFLGLYGVWLAWTMPETRVLVPALWALTLAAWLVPDAVWSHSAVQAGKLNLHYKTAIQGNKIIGVLRRWASLYEWPMQAMALIGMAIVIVRRDQRGLLLVGATLLFLIIEIGFAYHGFTAVPRYLLIAAAIMVALAGVGATQLIAGLPGLFAGHMSTRVAVVAAPLVFLGLLIALVPFAHLRESRIRVQLPAVRNFSVQATHLQQVAMRAGGHAAIVPCGQVVAALQYQTQVAWVTGLNVASIFFNPPLVLSAHKPTVVFNAVGPNGWTVRAYYEPPALRARCDRLTAAVASSGT